MAQKQLRAAIHVARKTFLIEHNLWVRQGDTVVDGHPILKGRAEYFEPFKPTFGELEVAESDPPSGLEAYAVLVARAKELGIPATGKAAELEAAIADAVALGEKADAAARTTS